MYTPSRCISGRSPNQQLRQNKDIVCDGGAPHPVLRLLAWPWSFDNPFFPLPVPFCFPSSVRLRFPAFAAPFPLVGLALPAAELDAVALPLPASSLLPFCQAWVRSRRAFF